MQRASHSGRWEVPVTLTWADLMHCCFVQARSRYFLNMVDAIARHGSGYKPPSSEALRSRLLVEAVHDIDQELEQLVDTAKDLGSTITSDGWSDARSRPLMNMLQVIPGGARMLDCIDTSGKTKARC